MQTDPEVADLVAREERREFEKVRLIPSENYVSRAVLEATGSVFTNKYSEGYAGKRYYEGQQCVDPLENLANARARALFAADHERAAVFGLWRTWLLHPAEARRHGHGMAFRTGPLTHG
jgi:glycine/serine hydroxymethyltransferase